jgi:hypothetical protein
MLRVRIRLDLKERNNRLHINNAILSEGDDFGADTG